MPRRPKIRRCAGCRAVLPPKSRAKYCDACAMGRVAESIKQLRAKRGPMFDRWRLNLAQSIEEMGESGEEA